MHSARIVFPASSGICVICVICVIGPSGDVSLHRAAPIRSDMGHQPMTQSNDGLRHDDANVLA